MRTLGSWVTFGLVAMMGLVGCTPPRAEDQSPYAILLSRPVAIDATADSFHQPHVTPRRFDLTVDDQPPRPIEHRAEPTDRFGASWRVIEGDLRELFLRHDDEGNVVLCAVIEHADRAISLFRPPLVVAYARLTPNEPRRQEVAMRVVERDRPQRLKEQGTTTQTITLLDDALLKHAAGESWVSRIEVAFVANLRMATVNREATYYIEPQRGVFVEESEKTIRTLGLIIQRTRERLVRRLEPGDPHP